MTDPSAAEESEQFARLKRIGLGIDAYTLTVRQGPERARVFAGLKEKDRKPVDPPPIIQLLLRDPMDPAQNYLQSPYFFMCCKLCDANIDRPGQFAAARLGEDIFHASQSALAGTVVSSLHRLKDTNNSDGGFFVFPDVSVKIEGEFRLRFSLFEMLKDSPKVVFIKSITSEPFTVYPARTFPGMSESTFLSRSFGDQGVKIRIRKEPRVLGKRSAPSDFPSSEPGWSQLQQSADTPGLGGSIAQQEQNEEIRSSKYGDSTFGYGEPPFKRRRPSVGSVGSSAYEDSTRSSQSAYPLHRNPYSQYPSREGSTSTSSPQYSHFPQDSRSASGRLAEYLPEDQRKESSFGSATTSSLGQEWPAPKATPNTMYQQPSRDYSQQYPYQQSTPSQSRSFAQSTQPQPHSLQPERQLPSSTSSHTSSIRPNLNTFSSQEQLGSYASSKGSLQGQRPKYPETDVHSPTQQSYAQATARTLPPPSQSLPSVLPPLGSNLPSSGQHPTSGRSDAEAGSSMYPFGSSDQSAQGYYSQPRQQNYSAG